MVSHGENSMTNQKTRTDSQKSENEILNELGMELDRLEKYFSHTCETLLYDMRHMLSYPREKVSSFGRKGFSQDEESHLYNLGEASENFVCQLSEYRETKSQLKRMLNSYCEKAISQIDKLARKE